MFQYYPVRKVAGVTKVLSKNKVLWITLCSDHGWANMRVVALWSLKSDDARIAERSLGNTEYGTCDFIARRHISHSGSERR